MTYAAGEILNSGINDNPQALRSLSLAIPTIFLVNVGTLTAVSTITTSEQTVTVPGLNVGDAVVVNKPTHQAGLGIVNARVSAANTLAITFMNTTAGSITPTASEVYKVVRFQITNA